MTVSDLSRQITARFGLAVDAAALDAWVDDVPVRQADLALAGAAASVLEVSLSDLFEVDLTTEQDDDGLVLDAARADRLSALLELQQSERLPEAEAHELEELIAEYGRQAQEHLLRARAARQGISVEQARQELSGQLDEAQAWWDAFRANPDRRRVAVAELRQRKQRATKRT
jgi:hypothetical protein